MKVRELLARQYPNINLMDNSVQTKLNKVKPMRQLSIVRRGDDLLMRISADYASTTIVINAEQMTARYSTTEGVWDNIQNSSIELLRTPDYVVTYIKHQIGNGITVSITGAVSYSYSVVNGEVTTAGLSGMRLRNAAKVVGIEYSLIDSIESSLSLTSDEIVLTVPDGKATISSANIIVEDIFGDKINHTLYYRHNGLDVALRNMEVRICTPELTSVIRDNYTCITADITHDGSTTYREGITNIASFIHDIVSQLPKEATTIKYISSGNTLSDVDYMGIDDEDVDIGTIVEAHIKPISEKDILMKALSRMYVTVGGADKDTADVSVVQKRNGEYTITLKLV